MKNGSFFRAHIENGHERQGKTVKAANATHMPLTLMAKPLSSPMFLNLPATLPPWK